VTGRGPPGCAIRAEARNGRILEIEKDAGKRCGITYEAEIRRMDGAAIEIEVAQCGKLLKVEVE